MKKTSRILINYSIIKEAIKVKLEKRLTWYDDIKREMMTFSGGRLVFDYKEDGFLAKMAVDERARRGITSTFRMIPRVEDVEIKRFKDSSNKEKIYKFYTDYLNYNNSEITIANQNDKGILFLVNEEEVDDFTYQLERSGFEAQEI